jgi:4-hydroxybenzoate polyprenyltransferase
VGDRLRVRALALLRASHPGPCLAVTAITVLLSVGAGARRAGPLALLVVAVFAGQLSIGWSNDALDAGRDAAAGRNDKPVARGDLNAHTVWTAAFVALAVAFGAALVLGPWTAAWLVPVVGGGWAYNAGLKSTPLSAAAYVVGFAPLPALAASILPGHPLARPWSAVAAAVLGVGAHFVNVLPDLQADQEAGVRGLPQLVALRGGERAVRLVALGLLLTASVLIAVVAAGAGSPFWTVTLRHLPLLVGLVSAFVLALVAARSTGRTAFRCALAIAGINVLMFVLGGGDLV